MNTRIHQFIEDALLRVYGPEALPREFIEKHVCDLADVRHLKRTLSEIERDILCCAGRRMEDDRSECFISSLHGYTRRTYR